MNTHPILNPTALDARPAHRLRATVKIHAPLVAMLLLAVCTTNTAHAQNSSVANLGDDNPDFQFALLRYGSGQWNPRPGGLARLAWEVRRRTSIAAKLETASVDATSSKLFDYPFIVWQGENAFAPLPPKAIKNLKQHLQMGGTLLVDASDGSASGGFMRSVVRELARIEPEEQLRRVPSDHVLYRSFYLVDRHGGRVPSRSYLEGLYIEDRLAVIITTNDLAGAMARDSFGEWTYDVGAGGETAREMTFRLGINLVMYALCLNYKADQVHIEYILERRR